MSTSRHHSRAERKPLKGFIQLNFGEDATPWLDGVLTNVSVTGLAFRTTKSSAMGRPGSVAEIHIRVPGWPDYVAYGSLVREEACPIGRLLALTFMSLPDDLYARLEAHTAK